MKTKVNDGNQITFTAAGTLTSGQGFLFGVMFVVIVSSGVSGDKVVGMRQGTYVLAKVSAQAWTIGAKVYWDDSAKLVTTTSSGNTWIGWAYEAAANPTATGTVTLCGGS